MYDFIKAENGQGLAEYSLLISLIALVVLGIVRLLGLGIKENFYDYIVGSWPE